MFRNFPEVFEPLFSVSGLQKGPAESGHVKNRQKVSNTRHFSTIFAQGKKTSNIVKKCQKVFRHFSTNFARRHFSGPFTGGSDSGPAKFPANFPPNFRAEKKIAGELLQEHRENVGSVLEPQLSVENRGESTFICTRAANLGMTERLCSACQPLAAPCAGRWLAGDHLSRARTHTHVQLADELKLGEAFLLTVGASLLPATHAQYDWTTGVLDNGNEWRKFRAVPRLRVEAEGLLDYQGRAGIISIVQWNLRPVVFGVEVKLLYLQSLKALIRRTFPL